MCCQGQDYVPLANVAQKLNAFHSFLGFLPSTATLQFLSPKRALRVHGLRLSLISVLSLIFCLPRVCASHIAAPFPDFPGLSPSPLAPGQVSAFLQLSRRSRGCHRSARSRDNLASFLPISLVRLRHFLKCFRSYWALASGSRHADGLALKLTPRSLNIAFSDAPAGRVRSISAWVLYQHSRRESGP